MKRASHDGAMRLKSAIVPAYVIPGGAAFVDADAILSTIGDGADVLTLFAGHPFQSHLAHFLARKDVLRDKGGTKRTVVAADAFTDLLVEARQPSVLRAAASVEQRAVLQRAQLILRELATIGAAKMFGDEP